MGKRKPRSCRAQELARNYLKRARLEEAAGKCLQKVLEFALQKGAEVLMKATKLLKAYGSPHS
jgi:hypothetical protein